MSKAIVLVSGGMDSSVVAHWAKAQGFGVVALSFDYGQRHRVELDCAAKVADAVGAEHVIQRVDLRAIGGSSLTSDLPVPKTRTSGIPPTYVPARNTIFLSFALAWCEATGARDMFIGVNALDYSGYPDCRPEYIDAFRALASLATKSPVRVHAPLVYMTKADIVREGLRLGVDFKVTLSCYDPNGSVSCGSCDACYLRSRGFAEAGATDSIEYMRR